MSEPTFGELALAGKKASYANEIKELIEQVGRGSVKVWEQANANALTPESLTLLTEVSLYLVDAVRLLRKLELLDAESPSRSNPEPSVIVSG